MAATSSSITSLWQHPFVNLFKQFPVGKHGDVSLVMDRDIKSTVHRVTGAVPAGNYVQVPRAGAHSLGLTGRYVYFLFKPISSKYFVVHMEAGTREGVAVRVSFSNLFKELKSTSTWLQFPFASTSAGTMDSAPRWALLTVDLQSALASFFNQTYMCLKSVKVCANVFIKGVFTSNLEYSPHHQTGQPGSSLATEPLPREMRLFLPKGAQFSGHYSSFTFPAKQSGSPSRAGTSAKAAHASHPHSPLHPTAVRPEHPPTVNVTSPSHTKHSGRANKEAAWTAEDGLGGSPPPAPMGSRQIVITRHGPDKPLSDAPLLQLERVVGLGGHASCPVLFSANGKEAVFACHHTVVAMDTASRRQRFFAGHSGKVSSLALSASGLLATGQGGAQAVVRVWQFSTAQCLALFKAHHSALHQLSLSPSGSILLGVGSDRQGRGSVVVWDLSSVISSGEVRVAAQAHTDVSIRRMRLSYSDSTRMASCGQGNIRLWRLKGKSLKSCPVDLGCHHQLLFTDVAFPEGEPSVTLGPRVFACTDSGLVLEVHCQAMSISHVWGLYPPTAPIGVTCLKIHECFAVTGHDDGSLCVWPADFSTVLLEACHDAPIGSLDVSQDGMTILTATLAGTLGMLDAASKKYSLLLRSHAGGIVSGSLHNSGRQLATTGLDQSVRVWQVASGNQTHEFHVAEDAPTTVDINPVAPLVAVGYQSGAMRIFSLSTSTLAAEHKHLTSERSCVLYSPNGAHLYSTSLGGTLAAYDATQGIHPLVKVLRGVASSKQGVKPLAVEKDGSRVAAVAVSNSIVSILDTADLQELLRLDIALVARGSDPSNHAVSLCFTATSSLLVLTVLGDLLRFNADSGALTSKLPSLHSTPCACVCAAPNDAHLLTSGDHCLKIWDYTSGKPLAPQVYLGHSEEVVEILITGKVCVTLAESICIWVYHGSNAIAHNGDDSSSLSPRRHAPSPVRYTRPLPSIAAPTPLQTFSHLGPEVECTPILSVPAGQCSTGCSSEASSSLITSDGLRHSVDYHLSEEGGGLSEEGGGLSEEGGGLSEEGGGLSEEGGGLSEEGGGLSEEGGGLSEEGGGLSEEGGGLSEVGGNMHGREGNTPSVDGVSRSGSENGRESCPSRLPNPPIQTTAPVCTPPTLLPAPPPQGGGRLQLHSVFGYSGSHQHNLVWHPLRGYMIYSSGSVVVLDQFSSTSRQGHLVRHNSTVSALALQSDGQTLASASAGGGEVLLWDLTSLTCKGQLSFHSSAVSTLAYSRDDRFLATVGGTKGGQLAVWSTVGYPLLAVAELKQATLDLAWDPFAANRLTTVGAGPHLSFWSLLEESSGRPSELQGTHVVVPQELMHTEVAEGGGAVVVLASTAKQCSLLLQDRRAAEFTAEAYGSSSKLFVASSTGEVCVWSTVKKVCLFHWRVSPSAVTALSWAGGLLVTGAVGGVLDLWEVKDSPGNVLKVVHCKSLQLDNTISCTSFEEKGEMGLVGTAQGSVHYISWRDSVCVKLVSGHSDMVTSCAVWGNSLATTCADGSVSLWCLPLELLASFSTPATSPTCVDVSPRSSLGRVRCAVGYCDGCLRTFDSKQMSKQVKMKPHDCTVTNVQYSTDGSRVLSGCAGGVVAVSSTTSGICLSIISDHQGSPIAAINTSGHSLHLPSCGPQPVQMWMVSSQDGRHSIWGSHWLENVHVLVDWLSCATSDRQHHSVARFNPGDADLVLYSTPSGPDSATVLNTYSISHHKLVGTTAVGFDVSDFDVSRDTSVVAVGDGVMALIDCDSGRMWTYRGLSGQLSNVSVVMETGGAICTIDSSVVLWEFPPDATSAQ